MEIFYIWLIIVFITLIVLTILYLRNRTWEELLENKQREFNIVKKLKNKRSLYYQKAVTYASFTLLVSAVGINQLHPVNNDGLYYGSDRSYKMFEMNSDAENDENISATGCVDVNSAWVNSRADQDNDYLNKYDLGDIYLNEMTVEAYHVEVIALCGVDTTILIYELDEKMYVYITMFDSIYELKPLQKDK